MRSRDGLILLIEDNKEDEELTLRAFKRNHLKNEIKVARDVTVQVALLDLKLPKLDGLEVLRRIRADPRTKFLPVVVLTSSKEEDLIASYRLGANRCVRKPVDFNEFVGAVTRLGCCWIVLNETAPGK